MCNSIYLQEALDLNKREETIAKLSFLIHLAHLDFDAVAFTGMSGALIAPSVADRLDKNLLMVRKDDCSSHSAQYYGEYLEGDLEAKKYIIIDDLISSGTTLEKMIKKLGKRKIVGIFFYSHEMKKYTRESFDMWGKRFKNCFVDSVYKSPCEP